MEIDAGCQLRIFKFETSILSIILGSFLLVEKRFSYDCILSTWTMAATIATQDRIVN
jgi:hypothetical protein